MEIRKSDNKCMTVSPSNNGIDNIENSQNKIIDKGYFKLALNIKKKKLLKNHNLHVIIKVNNLYKHLTKKVVM